MLVKRHSDFLLYVFVLGILVWLVLYPNLYLFVQSFLNVNNLTLAHYREFFRSSFPG